jgi:pSer/pThr/pTyr-binding forkhead associated (FHA) protein
MVFSLFRTAVPMLSQTGPGTQKQTHALSKEHTTIGRAAEADIVIDDPYLAPIHARLERQKNGSFVIRRTGLNPVQLRGEAMLQTAALKPGDTFQLGRDVAFELVVKSTSKAVKKDKDDKAPAAPAKPFFKRPAFLAGAGLFYIALIGGVAYALFGSASSEDGPSAARITAEANRISICVKNARHLKSISEEGFKGAVSTAGPAGAAYVRLASATEPSDETALRTAATPIADAYRSIMLAGFDAETRHNFAQARQLYQRGFDVVPDIKCSAARFAMTRRAASVPPAD